jgi:hypothetical protein
MLEHLKDERMCETFLSVAARRYPDLLATVRESIARAMSGWLMLDGIRAQVHWSEDEGCFLGRLRGMDEETICFRGETPAGMQAAFAKAAQEYIAARDALQIAESFQSGDGIPVTVEQQERHIDVRKHRKPSKPEQRRH